MSDILRALFVPTTITEKKTYWIGVVILVALGAAISFLPLMLIGDNADFASIMSAGMAGILLYLLIYPWFCLIAGRLRDAGASPWFYLLGLLGYVVIAQVLTMLLIMPGMMENMEGMMENMPQGEGDEAEMMNEMMQMQAGMMKEMLPKQAIAQGITSILSALPFGFLAQKIEGNRYRLGHEADAFN